MLIPRLFRICLPSLRSRFSAFLAADPPKLQASGWFMPRYGLDYFLETVFGHTGSVRPGTIAGPYQMGSLGALHSGKTETTILGGSRWQPCGSRRGGRTW